MVVLVAGLAARAALPALPTGGDDVICAPASEGEPLGPSSPEPTHSQLAPFVLEILDAITLARAGAPSIVALTDDTEEPRMAHASRVERPPIRLGSSS